MRVFGRPRQPQSGVCGRDVPKNGLVSSCSEGNKISEIETLEKYVRYGVSPESRRWLESECHLTTRPQWIMNSRPRRGTRDTVTPSYQPPSCLVPAYNPPCETASSEADQLLTNKHRDCGLPFQLALTMIARPSGRRTSILRPSTSILLRPGLSTEVRNRAVTLDNPGTRSVPE